MSKREDYCNAWEQFASEKHYYYNSATGTGYGCSAGTCECLRRAGIISASESFHAASNYEGVLADQTRFDKISYSADKVQKGDILVKWGYHVATWAGDGYKSLYECAPEKTHSLATNGTGCGLHRGHTLYNCGTGTYSWDYIYRIKEGDKMKNTELVSMALNIANNYPTHYRGTNGSSEAKYNIGAWDGTNFCFDCSGLIKAILWGWNGNKSAAYGGATYCANGVPDINDAGFYQNCEMHTDFSNIVEGALLWKSGHVGIYVGNGYAVECTPAFNGGVQKTAVAGRGWSAWGIMPYVEYGTSGHSTLQYGSTGSEVKTLQTLLNSHGASLDVDGSFGNLTKQAVISFQTANNLVVDGIVGQQTWTALEAEVEPTKELTAKERLQIAIDIIDGKYGSGSDRKNKLIAEFGETEAVKIQNIVNTAF